MPVFILQCNSKTSNRKTPNYFYLWIKLKGVFDKSWIMIENAINFYEKVKKEGSDLLQLFPFFHGYELP